MRTLKQRLNERNECVDNEDKVHFKYTLMRRGSNGTGGALLSSGFFSERGRKRGRSKLCRSNDARRRIPLQEDGQSKQALVMPACLS